MDNPLHASHYADQARVIRGAEIVANVRLARDTWRTRIVCPELAAAITPGQFVMLRLAGCDDPLIGRPLAMYDVWDADGAAQGIDVVYVVKGKLTTRLARLVPGQAVDVWGPLGNGFRPRDDCHLVLVAGGIGQTPFLALGKQRLGVRRYGRQHRGDPRPAQGGAERVTLCYGARTADLLAGVDDFRAAGMELRICTDDGSCGTRGLVTEELRRLLREQGEPDGREDTSPPPRVICCGPEPMMAAAARVAAEFHAACEVSLETPMACGIGICFSCVAKVRQADGHWDYKRTCVEGPVFDAACIEWD